MFRMEFEEFGTSLTVRILGRFVGHFAEEAKQLIARRKVPERLTVDISEMTFVDLNGEGALTWLSAVGASFVAQNSYSLDVCDRLRLRLAQGPVGRSRSQLLAD